MISAHKTTTSAVSHKFGNAIPPLEHRPFSDPSRLAPEDAFFAHSPHRRLGERIPDGQIEINGGDRVLGVTRTSPTSRRRREKERGRSGSRRRKGAWKKLLWVKQNCGNYLSSVFLEFTCVDV